VKRQHYLPPKAPIEPVDLVMVIVSFAAAFSLGVCILMGWA